VGSLNYLNIRLATEKSSNRTNTLAVDDNFEITGLTGTVAYHNSSTGNDVYDTHLHISVSDDKGKCLGGHVLPGCTILTTAEITLVNLVDVQYTRKLDPHTGYKELAVNPSSGGMFTDTHTEEDKL
jgi:uncharacterized protein